MKLHSLSLNFESFSWDLLASVGLVNMNGCKGQPSLSTKILSINDFITERLSKLPRDFYNKVHLKSLSKLLADSSFVNGPFF